MDRTNLFNGRPAYSRAPVDERPATARAVIQARREAGLTQEQLARLLGRDQVTIAHIETGRTPLSAERLEAILRAIAQVSGIQP